MILCYIMLFVWYYFNVFSDICKIRIHKILKMWVLISSILGLIQLIIIIRKYSGLLFYVVKWTIIFNGKKLYIKMIFISDIEKRALIKIVNKNGFYKEVFWEKEKRCQI